MHTIGPEFFSDPNHKDNKKFYSQKNPFKKKVKKTNGKPGAEPVHEGFTNLTLIVDQYKKNTSIYSSNRIVRSTASMAKMQLMEVQRQNVKLQSQVRELQKQVDKQNLISDEQNQKI